METNNVVNAVCDKLEAATISTRTRKTNEHADKESDVFKFPNADKSIWYKYEQLTASHRFDCESIRKAPDALTLLVAGIVSTVIIDDQKNGRALSADAFGKKYGSPDGVIIDVKDALAKKAKSDPLTSLLGKAQKMSPEQRAMLLAQIEAMV